MAHCLRLMEKRKRSRASKAAAATTHSRYGSLVNTSFSLVGGPWNTSRRNLEEKGM